jgi:hypothetical protein
MRTRPLEEYAISSACDGSGTRLIITPGEYARMSSAPGRIPCSYSFRSYWSLFGIARYYTDKALVYQRRLPPEQHTVAKWSLQKIERTHLTLRTHLKRFVRKTLGFSRLHFMHDLGIGVYMNSVEFGCPV